MSHGSVWDATPRPGNSAAGMIEDGYARSGVMTGGKIYRAEEAFDIEK